MYQATSGRAACVPTTILLSLLLSFAVPGSAQALNFDYSAFFHWTGMVADPDPGSYVDLALQGTHAYVAGSEGGLQVVSLADPSHPIVVGDYATPDDAVGVAVAWPYAYVAVSDAGLLVVDVTDPTNPLFEGSVPLPDLAQDVAVDGSLAFVAISSFGLIIVDVGDPSAPSILDWVDTPGEATGVIVWGDHLVVADGTSGIQIVTRDPYEIIKQVETPGTAVNVFAEGDYLYVADYSGGLAVIDAATIADAAIVGTLSGLPPVVDVVVDGDMALIANYYGGLVVVDVSDPTDPTFVSRSSGDYDAYGLAFDAGRIYLAADESFHTFLLGNGETALVFHHYDLNVPRVVALGQHYLYAIDYARLSTLEPNTGATVGLGAPLFDPLDICVFGSYGYIADGGAGLRVADLSCPGDPDLFPGMYLGGEARALVRHEDHLYVAVDGLGLAILSIEADPATPALVGFGGAPGQACDVVVQGNVAYVADGNQGLHLFDVSNPHNPTTLDQLSTEHEIGYVAAEGDYAYGLGADELVVYDVTDPADIQVLTTLHLQGPMRGIEVFDGVVYLVDPYVGLYVIDVSDPAAPAVVGGVIEGTYLVESLTLANDKLYVVDQQGVHLMPLHGTSTAVGDDPQGPDSVPPAGPYDVVVAPNPFNPRTTITFSLAAPGEVRAGVYDLTGGLVAVLADRRFAAGDHVLQWRGRDAAGRPMPSGVYVVRLGTVDGTRSQKVMLVR